MSITKICTIENCNNIIYSKNLCSKHYQRKLLGKPLTLDKFNNHGLTNTPEYNVWVDMIRRCTKPNRQNYKNYGGRGIRVCKRWLDSFPKFYEDMGARPSPKHQVERKDNEGNYEPGNCIWATPKEQANNRRSNTYIYINGETKTISQWCEQYGIATSTFINRIKAGGKGDYLISKPDKTNRPR